MMMMMIGLIRLFMFVKRLALGGFLSGIFCHVLCLFISCEEHAKVAKESSHVPPTPCSSKNSRFEVVVAAACSTCWNQQNQIKSDWE